MSDDSDTGEKPFAASEKRLASAREKGDIAKASVYAATDSKQKGKLTILVINKELRSIFTACKWKRCR